MTDFHKNITNLDHSQIRGLLRAHGVEIDMLVVPEEHTYKRSRCCAVHCEEIFMYSGRNPGYCTKSIRKLKNYRNAPVGVPYGQSKL